MMDSFFEQDKAIHIKRGLYPSTAQTRYFLSVLQDGIGWVWHKTVFAECYTTRIIVKYSNILD